MPPKWNNMCYMHFSHFSCLSWWIPWALCDNAHRRRLVIAKQINEKGRMVGNNWEDRNILDPNFVPFCDPLSSNGAQSHRVIIRQSLMYGLLLLQIEF